MPERLCSHPRELRLVKTHQVAEEQGDGALLVIGVKERLDSLRRRRPRSHKTVESPTGRASLHKR